MAEASVFLVLNKIGASLAESATSRITSKLVEDISVVREVDSSIKNIESEFVVMKAYLSQADVHKGNKKTFEAWLELLRKVAYEVEDTIDEYAYLTGRQQANRKTRFFRKTFPYSKNNVALRDIADQLKKIEARLQNLTNMKKRYDISITERGGGSNLTNYAHGEQHVSESSYLTSEDEIVGFGKETQDLIKLLTDGKQGRAIISIYGMGGLGKTTLARSIYKNETTKRHFGCRAWVSVSQNFHVDDLLRRIAKKFFEKNQAISKDIDTKDHTKLVETVKSHLQGRKYLIVLDDVWNKEAWSLLERTFVENNCGSRVVITTRSEDVASLAEDDCIKKLRTLSEKEAWDLFCKKAFVRLDGERCPESLKNWADKIVKKCQGLPLAIIAIGSLLSYRKKEEQEWRSFCEHLNWQLENNRELNGVANRVLNLSFIDLPSYLKNCFLYCGLFPEHHIITRKWLIRLWIAEGFIEERGSGMTMEEVAEDYLKELVHRCLLQVVERNDFGRVKLLQIHDIVREVTLARLRKEMFGIAYNNQEVIKLGDEDRRVSIQKGTKTLQPSVSSRRLRSFLFFGGKLSSSCIQTVSSSFRLLRVLSLRSANIDRVPDVVADLFNLHYLDLGHTKVKNIPTSLRKLLNLQTLDIRATSVEKLPNEISMLQKLRHLLASHHYDWECTTFDCFHGASVSDDISSLRSLQTLYGIESSRVLVQKIGSLTQLRTLYIMKVRRDYCEELWDSLAKMPLLSSLGLAASNLDEILNLEKLKPLPNLQKLKLRGRLEEVVLPSIFSSFGNLRELVMGWSGLREDPIAALSIMSNLVTLNLCMVYDGQVLAFQTGWFPMLKYLCLAGMQQLAWINVEDGAMKSLQTLELTGLQNLKMVPEGVKYLKSIQDMYLRDMPKAFIERLEGSDREIVHHIPNIVY
ncbi:disease resistance protein RPM1-like [Typha angustifolia]|uniref:disease resistance protein RPM1-like n=1 Tax=Typha angustifolia TaxID=59011 RepID=UPI003C2D314A